MVALALVSVPITLLGEVEHLAVLGSLGGAESLEPLTTSQVQAQAMLLLVGDASVVHGGRGVSDLIDAAVALGTLALAFAAFHQLRQAYQDKRAKQQDAEERLRFRAQLLLEMLQSLPGSGDRPETPTLEVLWHTDDLRLLEDTAAEVGGASLDAAREASRALRSLLALISSARQAAGGWVGRASPGKVPWSHVHWDEGPENKRWPTIWRRAEASLKILVQDES